MHGRRGEGRGRHRRRDGPFKGKNNSGAELDAQAEQVYEIRDGKMARVENKVDPEAWAKGWS